MLASLGGKSAGYLPARCCPHLGAANTQAGSVKQQPSRSPDRWRSVISHEVSVTMVEGEEADPAVLMSQIADPATSRNGARDGIQVPWSATQMSLPC
jgi:hypothetical protein